MMNTQTLLLDSLNTRWDKYKAELKICRREFSEAAVHDFRVAARRLLATLDLLRAVMQNPGTRKMRRILKDQLDNLDDLRDVQVLLLDISETIREFPPLQSFQEYLQGRESKLLRAARKKIKSLKIADLSRRVRKLNRTIEAFTQADPNVDLLSAVDTAYAVVNQRQALIDPARPVTIHRLRIAFKKFRYMVEAVYPILENLPDETLKRMHDYQIVMGSIQDMEAAFQELAKFEKHVPASYDPEPVRSYYKERHALAILRYFEDKSEIITFWRSAPVQRFPEEK
jgi:CHAD domain-containing protein